MFQFLKGTILLQELKVSVINPFTLKSEFFAIYDFDILRGDTHGTPPGEAIRRFAIFFSVCGQSVINIEKGHFFITSDDNELIPAGIYAIPEFLRFTKPVFYSEQDIQQLKSFWSVFKEQYHSNQYFALFSRRYFYSKIRLQWQDKIIDLMITLEALLVHENYGEKGKKISARLSRLLSPKYEAEKVAKTAEAAYKLRNDVVHGKIANYSPENETIIKEISFFTKHAIQEYLLNYSGLTSLELAESL